MKFIRRMFKKLDASMEKKSQCCCSKGNCDEESDIKSESESKSEK